MDYIRIQRGMTKSRYDDYNINVLNGRLDLKKGNIIRTHRPWTFQQINAKYDPDVVCEPDVDKMLSVVFCGDKQLYKLVRGNHGILPYEELPYAENFYIFWRWKQRQKYNFALISDFIGGGNYSTLSLQDIETTFRPAELENMLVNIGDDIPATTIKDSAATSKVLTTRRGNHRRERRISNHSISRIMRK